MSILYFFYLFFVLFSCEKIKMNKAINDKGTVVEEKEESKEKETLELEKEEKIKDILFLVQSEDFERLNKSLLLSSILSKTVEEGARIYFKDIDALQIGKAVREFKNFDAIIFISTTDYKKKIEIKDEIEVPFFSINTFEKCIKNKNAFCFASPTRTKILNIFSLLKLQNRNQLAVLLPNNNKGFLISQRIKDLAIKNNITIVNIEFYQENDEDSIKSSINKIKNNLVHYFITKDGKIFKKNLKEKNKKSNEEHDPKMLKTKFQTDSIYFVGTESNTETIVQSLKENGLLSYNIAFFTDSSIDLQKVSNKESMKDFYFLGYKDQISLPKNYTNLVDSSTETILFLKKAIEYVSEFIAKDGSAKNKNHFIELKSSVMTINDRFEPIEILISQE